MQLGLNDSKKNIRYLNVFEGTFRVKVPKGTLDAIDRINKNNVEVSELVYPSVAGYIRDIFIKKTDFGRRVSIVLEDDDGIEYHIAFGFADYLAVGIYKMLPNVNGSKPVRISLAIKADDSGKDRTSIFMMQEDSEGKEKFMKYAFTKDSPNGLPGLEKVMVKGEEINDNTKQVEFLLKTAVAPFVATIGAKDRLNTQEGADEAPEDAWEGLAAVAESHPQPFENPTMPEYDQYGK